MMNSLVSARLLVLRTLRRVAVLLSTGGLPAGFAHLQVITELLDRAPISAKQRLRIDGCVTDLSDVVGGCQRILNTPIPVSYTRCAGEGVVAS